MKMGWGCLGREASWSAPVLWRFGLRTGRESGSGLPQSKTLRAHAPSRHFQVSRSDPTPPPGSTGKAVSKESISPARRRHHGAPVRPRELAPCFRSRRGGVLLGLHAVSLSLPRAPAPPKETPRCACGLEGSAAYAPDEGQPARTKNRKWRGVRRHAMPRGGVGQPFQAAGCGGFPAASSQASRETGKSPQPADKNVRPTSGAGSATRFRVTPQAMLRGATKPENGVRGASRESFGVPGLAGAFGCARTESGSKLPHSKRFAQSGPACIFWSHQVPRRVVPHAMQIKEENEEDSPAAFASVFSVPSVAFSAQLARICQLCDNSVCVRRAVPL